MAHRALRDPGSRRCTGVLRPNAAYGASASIGSRAPASGQSWRRTPESRSPILQEELASLTAVGRVQMPADFRHRRPFRYRAAGFMTGADLGDGGWGVRPVL